MLNSKLGQTIESSFVDCSDLTTVDLTATGTITMHNLTVTGTFVGPAPEPSPDLACDTLTAEESVTTVSLTATGTTTLEDLVVNGTYTGPPAPVPSDIECETLTATTAIASPEAAFSGTVEVGTLNAETSTIGNLTVSGTLTATLPSPPLPSSASFSSLTATSRLNSPPLSVVTLSGSSNSVLTAAQVLNGGYFLVNPSLDLTVTLPNRTELETALGYTLTTGWYSPRSILVGQQSSFGATIILQSGVTFLSSNSTKVSYNISPLEFYMLFDGTNVRVATIQTAPVIRLISYTWPINAMSQSIAVTGLTTSSAVVCWLQDTAPPPMSGYICTSNTLTVYLSGGKGTTMVFRIAVLRF